MGDSYIECLVSRDKNIGYMVLRTAVYILAAICILLSFIGYTFLIIVGVILFLVGAFVCPDPEIEYEYLLIGKELSIDKIIAKSKRKKAAEYDLNKMEIMCPLNSHELDRYKSKNTPMKDFSSANKDSIPYVIVYHDEKGDTLVCVEALQEFISAVKSVMPRKVVEY